MYVARKKENSNDKIVWEGNPESLVRSINRSNSDKYPLLRGISLYEDTFFNYQQSKDLIAELSYLKESILDQKSKDEIESLIAFTNKIEIQELLMFSGD